MVVDGAAWKAALDGRLHAEEELLLIVLARTIPGDGGLTLMPIGTLYRWARRAAERASVRRESQTHGFPLRRRMIIALTNRRVVVWPLSRRPKGEPIGEVERSMISRAVRPTVGGSWRTVVLTLTSGHEVRIQVAGDGADALAKDLAGSV